jgi:hypothetical protein
MAERIDADKQDMEQASLIIGCFQIEEYLRGDDEVYVGRVYPEGKPPTSRWVGERWRRDSQRGVRVPFGGAL